MTDIRLRPLAEADLVERSEYYRSQGGDSLGARFFDAAIEALRDIERMPGAGSPRIGEMCGIDGLRSRRLERFPYGWFYFERSDHVDVVRLLAYAQDLETILGDLNQDP
ncbi:type II toxin-antitoxin system RelE/ParE family toxin [Candidatus Poriferisodalis sp.]|uniref:type II toxin-antitoxin system RelE/ParE family toxin n=1 Tax=Candidatus Poriferisodalis sp. TaxID=3101277 RepID=UPI003B52A381